MVSYTLDSVPPLTAQEEERLAALFARPDSEIDLTDPDAPMLSDEQWANAKRFPGKFYRPIKAQITAKVDSDVLAWLKADGPGYQSRMNAILRRAMLQALASDKAA